MNIEQTIIEQIRELRAQKDAQIATNNRRRKWVPWANQAKAQRKVDILSAKIFDLNNLLSRARKVSTR